MTALRDRVHGAVLGQAIGDALGAPTEGMTRDAIRAAHGRVTGFLSDDPAGTDDTEYAAFTARILLTYGPALTPDDVSTEWIRVLAGQHGAFNRGGFSEIEAIHNLSRGLRAPHSGSDNHEMWSDGSAMRVAPIGAYFAGDPAEAARIAGIDAQVSHARDGVLCGQAVAAAVAAATTTDDWQAVVAAGVTAIAADSWSARMINRALTVAAGPGTSEERLDELERRVSIFHYPWADVAPEATALAFGVFAIAEGDYVDSVLGGVNIGRDADTIAAMAGAMAGGLHGASAIPTEWSSRIVALRGSCIQDTAGVRLTALADEIADAVEARDAATRNGDPR
ncbi:ADP-ribosylglycohydrolase family protein [Micromonospora sp. NBC_01699]|uniref:ADP-ribosylglycohydrolase family protein n=1 Tax=Micromonospora sp. NBC_01699 TaxID=2975984 RepID=UPI002E2C24A9|nr:ADP-ribosylglycohydrolase family protein [Micromonospora sp. NBC_01699]